MSFARYPAYKQSAVAWLGSIPERWSILRLKHACEVFPSNVDKHARDDEPPIRLCNYTDVYYNERITADMSFMEATASTDQVARFTLRAGDTIITKDSETADDIAVSAYVPEDLPGVVCGYHLSMVRPRESICGAYVKRLFDCHYARARFAIAANGLTRVGLGQYALDNVEFPIPPFNEQAAIAAFLDRETAKIDALVEEQKRLIELLKEKRQAVISQAVTKGLDPNIPMKDSGVEWLGQVPAHWNMAAVSYRYEVQLGKMLDEKNISGEHLAPYLRNIDVQWDRINTDDLPQMDFKGDDVERFSLVWGDLLVCEGGEVGRAAIWKADLKECYYQKALHRLRIRDASSDRARFMFYILRMATNLGVFESNSGKSTISHLTAEALRRYRFAFPPVSEQEAIASFLDRHVEHSDAMIAEAESAMLLLQERRSALISAAVTGKIDVRGLAPQ
jgi:type I restriction enzyme S subunit